MAKRITFTHLRGRKVTPPSSSLLTDLASEILGPQLDITVSSAIGSDWAHYDTSWTTDVVQDGAVGWGAYHWANYQALGYDDPLDPGTDYALYGAGAQYDHPKIYYAFVKRLESSNPSLAATMLTIANEWTRQYVDYLVNYASPFCGVPTYHQNSDSLAIHYAQTLSADSLAAVGGLADYKMAGSIWANIAAGDPTSADIDGREQGRRLHIMALAYKLDAPTTLGGGTWGVRGVTHIPALIQAIRDTWNYQPSSGETIYDFPFPRIDHPGRQGLEQHDYMAKEFMDSLIIEGLIRCHRFCDFLSAGDKEDIVDFVRDIVQFWMITWDDYYKTIPYPQAAYENTDFDPPGVVHENACAAPEGTNFYLGPFMWLYYQTGDTTFKDWGDKVLAGAITNPIFAGFSVPLWGTKPLTKHVAEFYQGLSAAYYRQATPLATETRPINSVLPVITGTKTSGSTLTCSTGTWSGTPSSYSYRWISERDNLDNNGSPYYDYVDQEPQFHVGSDQTTYVLQASDIGKRIKCMVTAINANGSGVNCPTLLTTVVT